ncbi:hypothetical protein Tsubulata_036970 [Turnera subulata]|uniref:Replication factor A C-terminal domain-containing protein n=1 Tax=Turnera subulata TaxID=218843 RepID=A0A9Q0GCT6_9ROSI|nr:hypothetical protein Tsubulata_036970 [Turnera subulata]
MEGEKPTTVMCTVIAMDHSNLFYRVCSICERTLPPDTNTTTPAAASLICRFCNNNPITKRLFRLLVSIATDAQVINVICFDRAAKVLFGCSADDFFHFAKLHPFAAANAAKILEGEMFMMTLSKPKNGNAQHLRAVSIVPLKAGFRPAIESLKLLYGIKVKQSS